MKNFFVVMVVVLILTGCASAPEPTPTPTLEPTATITPTPDFSDEKSELIESILKGCESPSEIARLEFICESVEWRENTLRIKGRLFDEFVIEPENHNQQHWNVLNQMAKTWVVNYGEDITPFFTDDVVIQISSVGKYNRNSTVSKTPASVFLDIMSGYITTKAEWLAESEITVVP